ncbi:2-dehydropantoate 2-reductase [Pigmentiphaga soli]|uniref:2-dehydropantoate 2-reductase n=1 Tax=Pigmentiphaga soli TaxID=1007095 RepID=A0ABP8HK16_9BURK
MKVTIFGAGAVGSNVAVKLASAGVAEVSVVARGAHLAAIRERGLTLIQKGTRTTVRPAHATDDPATLPPQDLVISTLKANSLSAAAPALARLRAPDAAVLFLLNGIPWWWPHGLPAGHPAAAAPVDLLDPDGALRRELGFEAALGGVVYSPNEVIEPGVVQNHTRNQYVLGEPDGSISPRLQQAHDLFAAAGVDVSMQRDLRAELLYKLVINACSNPLCALTRLTAYQRLCDPGLRELAAQVIREVMAASEAMGWKLDVDIEAETDPARIKGSRPSMLQDTLLGRPLEVEPMLGQMQVLARSVGVPTPALDTITVLLRGLDLHLRRAGAPDPAAIEPVVR